MRFAKIMTPHLREFVKFLLQQFRQDNDVATIVMQNLVLYFSNRFYYLLDSFSPAYDIQNEIVFNPDNIKWSIEKISGTDMTMRLLHLRLMVLIIQFDPSEAVFRKLDFYNFRNVVSRIVPCSEYPEIEMELLEFQYLVTKNYQKCIEAPVDPRNEAHMEALDDMYTLIFGESRLNYKWKDIGFRDENPSSQFSSVGLLGLATIHFHLKQHGKFYYRSTWRLFNTMPIMTILLEVCRSVADVFGFMDPQRTLKFDPAILIFETETFNISVASFINLWSASHANDNEYDFKSILNIFEYHLASVRERINHSGLFEKEEFMREMDVSLLHLRARYLKSRALGELR